MTTSANDGDDGDELDESAANALVDYMTGRSTAANHPIVAAFQENAVLERQIRALSQGGFREPDLKTDEKYIGDYELLEKVAENMAVVYRARQRNLDQDVAVKVLLRRGSYLDRFRTESKTMARLAQHPNIVRILQVSRDDGVPFISMEWCSGGTLAERVAEYRSPAKAAEVVETIARAVHYVHQRGVWHRDLKPANILFDGLGQARVADFGLAVPVDGTGDAAAAGTPAYMAPEQLNGLVTVATDVYGLGAILYELLTGRAPSAADTSAAIYDRVRACNPDPPRKVNPAVDPYLDAICRKCLAKDPASRYASAEDLAAALESYRTGFRGLISGLVGQAAFVFCSNAAVFTLLRAGFAEMWVWLALFASYGPLFGILVHEWWSGRTEKPARRLMWSVWIGHALASLAVFIAVRIAAGDDFVHGIETGYIGTAGLNVLAFMVMGGFFAGRQYLLGLVWAVTAVIMGLAPTYAPLLYAVVMAVCTVVAWWQLHVW
jgi:serine/threonine-protein kinase